MFALELFAPLNNASAIGENKSFAMSPTHKFVFHAELRVFGSQVADVGTLARNDWCRLAGSLRGCS